MDNKKQNEYKKKLIEEKERLQKEIKELEKMPDMGDEPGFQDETEEAEEFYNQQAKADILRNRVSDVESALFKIQKSEFGTCEKCGEEIEDGALNVDPARELCVSCSKKENN